MEIKIAENGEGVENSNYKQLICRWDEFNEIIKKANELGGKCTTAVLMREAVKN